MSRRVLVLFLVLACLAGAPAMVQDKADDGLKKLSAILDAKPLVAGADADDLQRKLTERYNTALRLYQIREAGSIRGTVGPDQVVEAARLLLHAELALKSKPQEQLPVRKKMVDVAKWYEDLLTAAAH